MLRTPAKMLRTPAPSMEYLEVSGNDAAPSAYDANDHTEGGRRVLSMSELVVMRVGIDVRDAMKC